MDKSKAASGGKKLLRLTLHHTGRVSNKVVTERVKQHLQGVHITDDCNVTDVTIEVMDSDRG